MINKSFTSIHIMNYDARNSNNSPVLCSIRNCEIFLVSLSISRYQICFPSVTRMREVGVRFIWTTNIGSHPRYPGRVRRKEREREIRAFSTVERRNGYRVRLSRLRRPPCRSTSLASTRVTNRAHISIA